MVKKKDFIMVPRGIDKDPRLQPWMNQDYVNRREVLWAVERMMDRLSLQPKKRLTIQELTMGLYNSHLPYRLLKDIIIYSGFFDYNDAGVLYNWDLFVYDSEVEEEPQSPNCSPIVPQLTPNSTCARTSSSANRRVKYIETEKENNDEDKEKEKKEKAAARISQLVDEWVIDPTEENMPNREDVRRWMIWLLDLREGQAPYLLSKKCAIPNIKERWYDLVVSFAEHLALNGGFKKIKNYTEAQKYMSSVFTTKNRDAELEKFFPGVFIQKQMKEEEEAAHKAWVEEEKKRFPFEDYDPERGTRYVGNDLIPWDAPPRPDAVSTWDEEDCCWRSPAEMEERARRSHARFLEMLKSYNETHGKNQGRAGVGTNSQIVK